MPAAGGARVTGAAPEAEAAAETEAGRLGAGARVSERLSRRAAPRTMARGRGTRPARASPRHRAANGRRRGASEGGCCRGDGRGLGGERTYIICGRDAARESARNLL